MKLSISLILVFSVLARSVNMVATERIGADLIIQKKDGRPIRGELIAVKQESLLLLERGSEIDVSIDIRDIEVLVINKKSKALLGSGLGFLIGLSSGALIGITVGDTEQTSGGFHPTFFWHTAEFKAALFGVLGGVLGAIIGGSIGAGFGKNDAIQIDGKSESEVGEILEKLRKKARVPDYQ